MLPTPRILLGPGPSMADPRVLHAMATPLLGQFDPEFTAIMDEVMTLSRLVFQTASARTFPVSGTGRAGLEAAMVSLLEPGDRVVIGECGRFGVLLEDLARRCDADAIVVRAEWGEALDPVAYNARAEDALRRRRSTVRSNYLDLDQLASYWSPARVNHHTAPTAMVYGLREALRAVVQEGLPARFARHRLHGDALRAGTAALGLSLFGKEPPERRLPMLTPVVVPDGVDDARVRRALLDDFGIEIGAAFGPLQGKVWRIGTMGYSARRQNVLLLLSALEQGLRHEGGAVHAGAGHDRHPGHYPAAGAPP